MNPTSLLAFEITLPFRECAFLRLIADSRTSTFTIEVSQRSHPISISFLLPYQLSFALTIEFFVLFPSPS